MPCVPFLFIIMEDFTAQAVCYALCRHLRALPHGRSFFRIRRATFPLFFLIGTSGAKKINFFKKILKKRYFL